MTVEQIQEIKQVNYYPSAADHPRMWTAFDAAVIGADFAKIRALNANSVRIFLHPVAFGYPTPTKEAQAKLETVVGLAATHNLSVHLTLFDWFSTFTDIGGSKQWASEILAPHKGDGRISVVELHNEVVPSAPAMMTWVKKLLPYVKQLTPGQLNTVSVADHGIAPFQSLVTQLGPGSVDFWNYHYYEQLAADANHLGVVATITKLKAIAGAKPMFIGETGQSTYGHSDLNVQANYLRWMCQACKSEGVGFPSIWTLNDVADGQGVSPAQSLFGLYHADGTPKPAADAVRLAFAG